MANDEQNGKEDKSEPQYELTEKAYIDDRLCEIGEKISFTGTPGWHMKPLNEKAKALVKKHFPTGQAYFDPILKMAQI